MVAREGQQTRADPKEGERAERCDGGRCQSFHVGKVSQSGSSIGESRISEARWSSELLGWEYEDIATPLTVLPTHSFCSCRIALPRIRQPYATLIARTMLGRANIADNYILVAPAQHGPMSGLEVELRTRNPTPKEFLSRLFQNVEGYDNAWTYGYRTSKSCPELFMKNIIRLYPRS